MSLPRQWMQCSELYYDQSAGKLTELEKTNITAFINKEFNIHQGVQIL